MSGPVGGAGGRGYGAGGAVGLVMTLGGSGLGVRVGALVVLVGLGVVNGLCVVTVVVVVQSRQYHTSVHCCAHSSGECCWPGSTQSGSTRTSSHTSLYATHSHVRFGARTQFCGGAAAGEGGS